MFLFCRDSNPRNQLTVFKGNRHERQTTDCRFEYSDCDSPIGSFTFQGAVSFSFFGLQ